MSKDKKASDGGIFEVDRPPRRGPITWLRSRFLTGLVVAAPIGITIWLVWMFVTFVDSRIKPLIPAQWNPETYTKFALPGLGVFIAVVGLIIIGTIAANLIGKSLLTYGENLLIRVPLVRTIYTLFKQLFETLASSQAASFKEVVMLQYPREGTWAVGFITAPTKGEMHDKFPDLVGVFVPTTPNPTSGFLIYVPRGDLVTLDMSVEEGAKLIISAGLVTPEIADDPPFITGK